MKQYICCLVLGILLADKCQSVEIPSVTTKHGEIIGYYSRVDFKDKTYSVKRFLGIPYAKPPIGNLRFKKPEPVDELSPNPFYADKFGSACAQVDIFDQKIVEDSMSEDCLFLNVFVPLQDPDTETGHAVMVFIHGGAFSFLSGNRFISDRLASVGNVIVVTLNYRLWVWGFLDINDERAPGNMGLWDQQLALKWIQGNIGHFGGDKDRVTIFGESAGAISVGLHALYPGNKGLFQNVIAESGAPTTLNVVEDIYDTLQPATLLAKLLNCSTENKDAVFNCIQALDSETMIEAFKTLSKEPSSSMDMLFIPTIDGEFMKRSPADIVERAKTDILAEVEFLRSLCYINGFNGDEGGMWLNLIDGAKENYEDLQLSKEAMDTYVTPGILSLTMGSAHQPSNTIKSLVNFRYTDWENPNENKRVLKQYVKLVGDLYFNVPGIELSRLHANGSTAGSYMYRFTAALQRHIIPTPSWLTSANHADELGPVFGFNLDYEWFDHVKEEYSPQAWELDLSERMMTFWTNFAKTSNPNGKNSNDKWPKYTLESEQYLNIDREDHVGQRLHADDVQFWREIVPRIVENCQVESSPFLKPPESCDADGGCE